MFLFNLSYVSHQKHQSNFKAKPFSFYSSFQNGISPRMDLFIFNNLEMKKKI